ncbi:hypothetical protein [Bradyrhizobium sp.]|uniref:hypothetical protein n=1 Tax=Bradyrhizobium sp. TaxID=376 RepID=UPI003C72EC44
MLLKNLMPASGHQDHTTSPSAFAPFVLPRQSVHRIPRSTSVTIAKRPSRRGGTAGDVSLIWVEEKAECFFKRDWTGRIALNRLKKFDFARMRRRPDATQLVITGLDPVIHPSSEKGLLAKIDGCPDQVRA